MNRPTLTPGAGPVPPSLPTGEVSQGDEDAAAVGELDDVVAQRLRLASPPANGLATADDPPAPSLARRQQIAGEKRAYGSVR